MEGEKEDRPDRTMHILYPTDGCPGAAAALDKLIASFDAPGLLVEVLAVVDRRGGRADAALASGHEPADEILASARSRLEQAGIEVQVAVLTGHPADEIVAYALARQPDVVMLGSRPAAEGAPGFSGRVASKVARYSPSPVFIARDGLPLRSVVLGYDASLDADVALSLLARLPFRDPPRVAVCAAYEVDAPFSSGIAPTVRAQAWASRHEQLAEAKRAAETIAEDAAERLRNVGLAATAHAVHGRPSEQLTVLAGELGADLIAIGSRGLSGVERFLLGSTSGELVALAPTSLLVARS